MVLSRCLCSLKTKMRKQTLIISWKRGGAVCSCGVLASVDWALMVLFTAAQGHRLYLSSYRGILCLSFIGALCVCVQWAPTQTQLQSCQKKKLAVSKQCCCRAEMFNPVNMWFVCFCVCVCQAVLQKLLICLSLHLQILLPWTDATGVQYKFPLSIFPAQPPALTPTSLLPAPLLQLSVLSQLKCQFSSPVTFKITSYGYLIFASFLCHHPVTKDFSSVKWFLAAQ